MLNSQQRTRFRVAGWRSGQVDRVSVVSMILVAIAMPSVGLAFDKKPDAQAIRKQQLAQADARARQANMAAYQEQVTPFLKQYCVKCHQEEKQEGELSLVSLDPDMKLSTSAARWATVRERLESAEMPPEDHPQPKAAEVDTVLAWIKAEMKRSRRNFTRRQQFMHGNRVPHAWLFDASRKSSLDVPPRVRRYSADIYETFRAEQAKGFENLVGNPFTPDPRFPFRDMGTPKIDVPTTSQLLRNALTVIQRQTGFRREGQTMKPLPGTKKEFLPFVDETQPLNAAAMEKAVTMQFQRTLARQPSPAERERFLQLMQKNVADAGRVAGVRYTLAAVYLLPEAVFRYEVGGIPDESGKARLTPMETADALAYALTDKRPDAWLIKAAQSGQLDDANDVATAVARMLNDRKLEKPRILRFFHEYFEYPKAVEVFKDSKEFRGHKARVLVSDTDNLIRWILDRDQQVLKELLTTDHAFVNSRYNSKTGKVEQYERKAAVHESYRLPPDWKWTDEQPVKMPSGTRAGILTQPSWLVAWSMNQDNHAILRGKWVRERLLGNVVPDIPITVDAQLPDEPDKTLRHRMRVTREEYCWQCHKLMNPVGMPFEAYDHFGRWRAIELDQPVDASGRIDLTGDTRLDGIETKDAVELLSHLAESERVEQVFIRHVFRYLTGRNENLGDGPSLRDAHRAYRESGGSFKALVTSILCSESFLYRTPGDDMSSGSAPKVEPNKPPNE